jgi:hypothetical protein
MTMTDLARNVDRVACTFVTAAMLAALPLAAFMFAAPSF